MKFFAVVICSLMLVACGGGGNGSRTNSVIVSGVASKGLLKDSTVCAYTVVNGAQGVQVGTCSSTSGDGSGSYSVDVAGYTGPIMLQVSGGTYIDEATGTTVTLSTPLRSVVSNLTTSSTVAVSALTELAYQLAAGASGGMTPSNIQAAVTSAQNNFGLLDIVGTMPINALNVPAGASAQQKNYSLALAAVSQYLAEKPAGSTLLGTLQELKTCLSDSTKGCSVGTTSVGALLNTAVQKFAVQHSALSGINLPVASFGSVATIAGNKSVVHRILAAVSVSSCPNGGATVVSGIDTNGNGVLDDSEVTNTQFVCNGISGTSALVAVSKEPVGINCLTAGSRVSAGMDVNANGTLDSSEITSTSYICNGGRIQPVDATSWLNRSAGVS